MLVTGTTTRYVRDRYRFHARENHYVWCSTVVTADRQTEEKNKQIARRVPEELATEGNPDLVEELFATDAVEHDPLGDHRGRESIRENIEGILAAFPDISATVEEIIAEGDLVAMRVALRGTHDGEFVGVAPTGKEFEIGNMVFTRIEDGMIVERWVQPDTLGLVQQLGIDPSAMKA